MSDRKVVLEDNPCGLLLHAIERVRTRFAIAIASEKKITSLDRWHSYLDTEDQIRRVLKELRSQRWSDMTWHEAIDVLRRIPDALDPQEECPEAQVLCRQLREVMARLQPRSCRENHSAETQRNAEGAEQEPATS